MRNQAEEALQRQIDAADTVLSTVRCIRKAFAISSVRGNEREREMGERPEGSE